MMSRSVVRRLLCRILSIILWSLPAPLSALAYSCPDCIGDTTVISAERPVTGIYAIEVGNRRSVAEYLSPICYSGTEWAASGHWSKVMPFSPERAMMSFEGRIGYASMLNPSRSARTHGLEGYFGWQMHGYWRLPYGLTVSVGGGPRLTGGVLALLRNSNNPVDVTIKMALEAGATLSWRSRIGKLPIVVSDRLSLPIAGAFFMPQYGETFYEIYLGNRRGLAHFGWCGNMPGVDNVISVSLDFGKTAMTIGYRLYYGSAYANNLSTRTLSNGFVIGVIPHGLGMKRRHCRREIRPF